MNSTEYKGRPACIYDGWCHVGCPTGALANPLVTYLGEARKAGAEVRALCDGHARADQPGRHAVTGVEYYDAKKEKQVQEASVVVLAAWSAQNPRMLLNSATDKHPKGLANSSGLVGKYMMTHFSSGTWAIFDEDVAEPHGHDRRAVSCPTTATTRRSHKGAFGSTFIVAGSAQQDERLGGFANARVDLFGPTLARVHEARGARLHPHQRVRRGNAEHREPRSSSRATRTSSACRSAGSSTASTRTRWRCGTPTSTRASKIAKATGAKEVWSARGSMPTIHLHGRHHHGHRRGNSVVNSYGQTHEIANLWIAGPGIFPTEGASNPTYTIFAVSLRGAEQLATKWGDGRGVIAFPPPDCGERGPLELA